MEDPLETILVILSLWATMEVNSINNSNFKWLIKKSTEEQHFLEVQIWVKTSSDLVCLKMFLIKTERCKLN